MRSISIASEPSNSSRTELLSRILCYGLTSGEPGPESPHLARQEGFIQGSIFLFDGKRPVNTSIVDSMSKLPDAVRLEQVNGIPSIRNGNDVIPCPPLVQPEACDTVFHGYGRVGDFVQFHSPKAIFGAPVRQCIFGAVGKPCQFCTFDMSKPKPLPPRTFAEMFDLVRGGRNDVSLALGPGTPNLLDHGVTYITEVIREVRKTWDGPISVELVPPRQVTDLDKLVDVGVRSIIMSIEVWDESRRLAVCPGKSYVSKDNYLASWDRMTTKLGRGSVSSVLLVGLEDMAATEDGINEMTRRGVIPTLIPFRPYDNIPMSDWPLTNHRSYLRLSKVNALALRSYDLRPADQLGCTECGGCSLDNLSPELFQQS